MPEAQRYEQILPEQAAQFAATVCALPSNGHVPTCPEWTVADLAEHIGQTYAFFAGLIEDRVVDMTQVRMPEETIPKDQAEWEPWLSEAAARLVEAVRTAGPSAAVWNPTGETTGGAPYWLRRAFGETVAHRADASAAAGESFELETDLAVDAVSEFLEMVTSPTWAMNRPESADGMRGVGQTLHWHATDAGSGAAHSGSGEWLITRSPDGPILEHGHAKADLTVRGTATTLLCVLLRRTPVERAIADGVEVTGDRSLLDDWLELMKF